MRVRVTQPTHTKKEQRTCHVDIRAGVSRDGAGDELCISLQLRWDRALVEFGRVAVLEIPAKTRNVTAIGKTLHTHVLLFSQ